MRRFDCLRPVAFCHISDNLPLKIIRMAIMPIPELFLILTLDQGEFLVHLIMFGRQVQFCFTLKPKFGPGCLKCQYSCPALTPPSWGPFQSFHSTDWKMKAYEPVSAFVIAIAIDKQFSAPWQKCTSISCLSGYPERIAGAVGSRKYQHPKFILNDNVSTIKCDIQTVVVSIQHVRRFPTLNSTAIYRNGRYSKVPRALALVVFMSPVMPSQAGFNLKLMMISKLLVHPSHFKVLLERYTIQSVSNFLLLVKRAALFVVD